MTLEDSPVWYAKRLLALFPDGIPVHGYKYSAADLPCVATDLASFDVRAQTVDIGVGPAFAVEGSLTLDQLPKPFGVFDGAQGKRYMVHLQAFLVSADGRVVWSQHGFPKGGAWVDADGAECAFTLIDRLSGSARGCALWLLVAGDPIFSPSLETRVLLGADRIKL